MLPQTGWRDTSANLFNSPLQRFAGNDGFVYGCFQLIDSRQKRHRVLYGAISRQCHLRRRIQQTHHRLVAIYNIDRRLTYRLYAREQSADTSYRTFGQKNERNPKRIHTYRLLSAVIARQSTKCGNGCCCEVSKTCFSFIFRTTGQHVIYS